MSILIDELIKNSMGLEARMESYWYKPKPYFGWEGLRARLNDAWRVLIGKSRAYHYKEDEE